MKARAVGRTPATNNEYSIARANPALLSGASASGSAIHGARSLLARTAPLVLAFWMLVLTMMLYLHIMAPKPTAPALRHGIMALTLSAKLNVLVPAMPAFDALLSYRICCRFPGPRMECPDAREMECHMMSDAGSRLNCYWLAPRLEGAQCTLYWVAAAAANPSS